MYTNEKEEIEKMEEIEEVEEKELIENETLYEGENEEDFRDPFDPRLVDISSQPMILSNIVDRLKDGEIELNPDFQRNPNLWDKKRQSRLIESLLIRIPLPIFYFDMTEDEKLIVVDGVQRLSAIKNFMVASADDPHYLKLEGMEYLKEMEGKCFEDLPSNLKRRLREQIIQTYVIKAGTPDKVRNSIFERINTGGLVLTPAEIKNSVYRGRAANLLREMSRVQAFIDATRGRISPERMLDREFVNRFLAFYLLGIEKYKGSLEDYLNDALILVKNNTEINLKDIVDRFEQAMSISINLFGGTAFRKKNKDGKYGGINKPLFETLSVEFAKLSPAECDVLLNNKKRFLYEYEELLNDTVFVRVITSGTASIQSVQHRHVVIHDLIRNNMKG